MLHLPLEQFRKELLLAVCQAGWPHGCVLGSEIELQVWVLALDWDILTCSWARCFSLTVSLPCPPRCISKKVESAYKPIVAHQAGAYASVCSMKRIRVFLHPPGWDASPS